MSRYTALNDEDSVTDRWRDRQEWEQWLATLKFDSFVTLNFNRDTTPAGARRMLGLFLARLNRRFLGRRWCEKGGSGRLAWPCWKTRRPLIPIRRNNDAKTKGLDQLF